MSKLADDNGAISLVIENEVSGNALANDASKASRLLRRLLSPPGPTDDDDDDAFLGYLIKPPPAASTEIPSISPPPTPAPDEAEETGMTSSGIRSSVLLLLALRT
jgi:hypothetical protein